MFLKKRYGTGYNLTVVKDQDNFDMQIIFSFLRNNLGPDIKILSETSSEVVFQIPTDYSSMFSTFFTKFDQSLGQLNIKGYGVAVTSLEDVFLKVGQKEDKVVANEPALE